MAATTSLLTVAEFVKIPDPPEGRYELHHGELIHVPPPKIAHAMIQDQLLELLLSRRDRAYHVSKELAFRPAAEHEVWICDIGVFLRSRWLTAGSDNWLQGAPEIVIEVLSPSNTVLEMNDREKTCFEGGCQQFWVINPKHRSVRIITPDGHAVTHENSASIQLNTIRGASIGIAEIVAAVAE